MNNTPPHPNGDPFKNRAAAWEEKPQRLELTAALARAIMNRIPLRPDMTALEFGAGTGLLTCRLAPALRRITAVDASPDMLAVLREKIAAGPFDNIRICPGDISRPLDLPAPFDLIYAAMTLHHLPGLDLLFPRLLQFLRPGGLLALADLDAEDGSFHPDPTGVYHHGFDRAALADRLEKTGFENIRFDTVHAIRRPDSSGFDRDYPVFLLTANKP